MRPMFFGSSVRPLFGVHHAPAGTARDTGVVLFYPGVHEYLSSHWALRSLASTMAGRGFHVLRFDYRGTGDSAGEPEETTLEACVEDARAACEEIRDVAGISRVSLVGLRLGAVIASLASALETAVEDLFLWDPVVSGASYLEELELLDATMRLRLLHPPRRGSDELAGYPFPPRVRDSIARIDLCGQEAPTARRIGVFVAQPRADVLALRDALERRGTKIDVHVIGSRTSLGQAGARQAAMMAGDAVATIATHIETREW
jgi:uncharacterized protein